MIFFASASANQNDLVEREAQKAGATDIRVSSGGVEFEADLETAYRFAMWTRSATRLLVLVYRDDTIGSTDELYEKTMTLPWENWINPSVTFAITETVSDCRWITNSHFAALRLKDAIVERIRTKFDGERPSVDRDNPDIVFHLHVNRNLVSLYIDFAGRDLSRRGYRTEQTVAVMGEFMAASFIYRSDWYKSLQASFEEGAECRNLVDPFCGSGTICIEAALMATNTAPGLVKPDRFAFFKLPIHDEEVWQKVYDEADAATCEPKCRIYGFDISREAVEISRRNAERAGVDSFVTFEVANFANTTEESYEQYAPAVIVTDPPYGVRLDDTSAGLIKLYTMIGNRMTTCCPGWSISILSGNPELLAAIEMKPNRTNVLINGGIECQAAHYYVFSHEEREAMLERARLKREERLNTPLTPGAQMAANRLQKNLASLGKEMAKQGVTCYRLYDADMPEYNAAIDIYEGKWICLQEYAAPDSVSPEDAARRLEELVLATERVTGIDLENIYVKKREVQRGASQYSRRNSATANHFNIVNENGHKFMVNFTDYLDTGIFLDHRPVRKLIEGMAENKRFLNLFCYTGSATVHAAAGGALSTVSVDTNGNYLDWAMKNMQVNRLDTMNHFYYRQDSISFLKESHDYFDLIFCDPPTFSNNKARGTFDVQRDHNFLIRSCMRRLSGNGTLVFSNNFTRFRMDEDIMEDFDVEDITESTIGDDFKRNPKIHKCYLIRFRTGKAVRHEKAPRKIVRRKEETV